MTPKTGQLIIFIGGTGSGKTTAVKKLIAPAPESIVYDVNGEYQEYPFDANAKKSRFFDPDVDKFLEVCSYKNNACACVCEEATNFFAGAAQAKTRAAMVAKRHPQELGGRNYIFVFHTINSVPPFLFGMSNTVCLFKTNDELHQVKKKCAKLVGAFLKLQKEPKYSRINIEMQ